MSKHKLFQIVTRASVLLTTKHYNKPPYQEKQHRKKHSPRRAAKNLHKLVPSNTDSGIALMCWVQKKNYIKLKKATEPKGTRMLLMLTDLRNLSNESGAKRKKSQSHSTHVSPLGFRGTAFTSARSSNRAKRQVA